MSQASGAISLIGDTMTGVLDFVGNYLAWDAKSREMQRDMQLADENAGIAAAASADAIRRGNIEAAKLRLQGTQLISEQQANYLAGGVDPTTGTPADVGGYSATVVESDAQTAANNAAREAWGQRKQSERFKQQRSDLRAKYDAEQTSYSLNQVGTIGKTALNSWSSALEASGG